MFGNFFSATELAMGFYTASVCLLLTSYHVIELSFIAEQNYSKEEVQRSVDEQREMLEKLKYVGSLGLCTKPDIAGKLCTPWMKCSLGFTQLILIELRFSVAIKQRYSESTEHSHVSESAAEATSEASRVTSDGSETNSPSADAIPATDLIPLTPTQGQIALQNLIIV